MTRGGFSARGRGFPFQKRHNEIGTLERDSPARSKPFQSVPMVLERDTLGKRSDYIELVIFFTLVPTFQCFYHTSIFSPQTTPTISRNWNVGTSIEMPEKDARTIDSITHLRRGVITLGYRVIPLRGKRGAMDNWSKAKWRIEQLEGISRNFPDATNTGILTGEVVGLDIDTPDPDVSATILAMVAELRGISASPFRVGRPPKRLHLFRTSEPRSKAQTGAYLINGHKCQVEVLGVGQQVAAFGVHPETDRAYEWHNGSPAETPLADLPEIDWPDIEALLARAEEYFAARGALIKPASKPRDDRPVSVVDSDHPWAIINSRAFANLEAWVPDLGLEGRRRYQSGYHAVASFRPSRSATATRRGRSLNIQPSGIVDYSDGNTGYSPINLVAVCLSLPAPDAADWLHQRVGGDTTPAVSVAGLLSQAARRAATNAT
jgi:hypothetical protein